MKWNQANPGDLLPEVTESEVIGRRTARQASRTLAADVITLGNTQFLYELKWHAELYHPETWTDEEAVESFHELLSVVQADALKRLAVTECALVLSRLPDEVVPTVLEQFSEIAEYETRIWFAEHTKPRAIQEHIAYLPVGK